MKIVGLMVTHNEEDRYLEKALESLRYQCDRIAVFDDQSTDNTLRIAAEFGLVQLRPDKVPSFLEHEGRFRQAAWDWATRWCMVDPGDWIVSLDADEILTGDLRAEIRTLDELTDGLVIPIDELWALDPPKRRVDGWWGKVIGLRARKFEVGLRVPDKAMASGSVPNAPRARRALRTRISHMGYVRAADRQAKHDRYITRDGHSGAHVRSILNPNPTLELVL